MERAARPRLAVRTQGQREVAHTSALSLWGLRPGAHNDLFRARADAVETLPMPHRIKAS